MDALTSQLHHYTYTCSYVAKVRYIQLAPEVDNEKGNCSSHASLRGCGLLNAYMRLSTISKISLRTFHFSYSADGHCSPPSLCTRYTTLGHAS